MGAEPAGAVGAGGSVVWAEGFEWRDVVTQAPVTPDTRFNIRTPASAVDIATWMMSVGSRSQ